MDKTDEWTWRQQHVNEQQQTCLWTKRWAANNIEWVEQNNDGFEHMSIKQNNKRHIMLRQAWQAKHKTNKTEQLKHEQQNMKNNVKQ